MAKKLYVGNLSYGVTEDELREAFAKFGEVQSVRIIRDEATGRPRGFGFVEIASDEEAQKAITGLDGATLQDRPIKVSEARPQAERGRTGGGRPGGPGGRFGGGRGKGPDRWR
ncbi:MAG: RNA-binding protein [Nitrospiraceae bacterium]|nr:RNA-binding protein [Nitrospiraceae bacterium]